ncbi:hypothetical protein [Methylobacterium sp. Leaf118]|uniref:hypothetical protein n=1 Tax=Methylobacterium sp. Leaf118 TaxID=2876562 RepID=UPI001E2B9E57|nr:hypothetical protein [Methylobacterium sp. Leaf118]
MLDLYLTAPSEADLAAALPMLRVHDDKHGDVWQSAGLHHAMDAGFEFPDAPGYHANLRLLDGHPDRAAILAAAEPFRVEPATPRRVFAGGVEDQPVPPIISDRQFAQRLAEIGIITRDEALAFVKRGDVPAALQAAIDAIPGEADRFAADMQVSGATVFERSHPSTLALAQALGWSSAQMDDLWRRAAAL